MEIKENPQAEQHKFKKVRFVAAASAALLMGGDQAIHANYDNAHTDASHALSLSSEDLQKIQGDEKTKLKFSVRMPEIAAGENMIQSGANTHLSVNTEPFGYADLETFEKQVDLIKSYHQTEIRFGIPRWDVAKLSVDKKTIIWNEGELEYFKKASLYAQEKGLEVFFISTPPEVPIDFDFSQYLEITRQYYERIGSEFKGVIHQPGNEYDVHNLFNYQTFDTEISDEQLSQYCLWLDTATRAIRRSNSLVKITQSLSGYPMDEMTINRWKRINSAIGKFIDFYSLDTYPRNKEEAKKLPHIVNEFGRITGKDFVITELGLPTYGGYTDKDQGEIMSSAINAYKEAGIKTLIYELKDEKFDDVEGHFGLIDRYGNQKSGFSSVMTELQEEGKFK